MTKKNEEISRESEYADRLRREMRELSDKSLAQKFDLVFPGETLAQGARRIVNITRDRARHEDSDLLKECHRERARLRKELKNYSDQAISRRHGTASSGVCK